MYKIKIVDRSQALACQSPGDDGVLQHSTEEGGGGQVLGGWSCCVPAVWPLPPTELDLESLATIACVFFVMYILTTMANCDTADIFYEI